jgi:hypothetical protein
MSRVTAYGRQAVRRGQAKRAWAAALRRERCRTHLQAIEIKLLFEK